MTRTSAVLFAVLVCGSALSEPTDELQRWIDENAVAVRSIDSADQDFRDLEPLIDAIGSGAPFANLRFVAAHKSLRGKRLCCAFKDARARKYVELTSTGTSGKDLEKAMATWERQKGTELQPTKRDLDALQNAARSLLATIHDHRTLFEQVHGAKETSFMEQAIENLRTDGAGKLDINHGVSGGTHASVRNVVSYFNRRDEQNARNLRWLLDKGYPGRKVIVWAHNAHVTYAHFAPEFAAVHLAPQPEDMKPTGAYLHEWLGNEVYTIGFTTYQGNDGWATGSVVTAVPPAPEGSLESRLHALDSPHIFLDLRTPSENPQHPLRKPLSMRMLIPASGSDPAAPTHGNYKVDDITRVFDGLFYIDETTPATRL